MNFIAAHDGFCLRDLVSYCEKHNWANGEDNRDGSSDNISWNNGTEGETNDEHIIAHRRRDVRALLATLFLSQGTVMLTAGDELGKTQDGNNNAYAQDNATTWLDWVSQDNELIAFVAQLAKLRNKMQVLRRANYLTADDVTWLRPDGQAMNEHDWHNNSQVLGMRLRHDEGDVCAWFNASHTDAPLLLPSDADWLCVLNSASESFNPLVPVVYARSVLVLQSQTQSKDIKDA